MDIVFNKWWLPSLVKPSKSGLLSSCVSDSIFAFQLKPVIKILKLIFFDKEPDPQLSHALNHFIAAKK